MISKLLNPVAFFSPHLIFLQDLKQLVIPLSLQYFLALVPKILHICLPHISMAAPFESPLLVHLNLSNFSNLQG